MKSPCDYYAENLLIEFAAFAGRIGYRCDDCKIRDCIHHGDNRESEIYAIAGK